MSKDFDLEPPKAPAAKKEQKGFFSKLFSSKKQDSTPAIPTPDSAEIQELRDKLGIGPTKSAQEHFDKLDEHANTDADEQAAQYDKEQESIPEEGSLDHAAQEKESTMIPSQDTSVAIDPELVEAHNNAELEEEQQEPKEFHVDDFSQEVPDAEETNEESPFAQEEIEQIDTHENSEFSQDVPEKFAPSLDDIPSPLTQDIIPEQAAPTQETPSSSFADEPQATSQGTEATLVSDESKTDFAQEPIPEPESQDIPVPDFSADDPVPEPIQEESPFAATPDVEPTTPLSLSQQNSPGQQTSHFSEDHEELVQQHLPEPEDSPFAQEVEDSPVHQEPSLSSPFSFEDEEPSEPYQSQEPSTNFSQEDPSPAQESSAFTLESHIEDTAGSEEDAYEMEESTPELDDSLVKQTEKTLEEEMDNQPEVPLVIPEKKKSRTKKKKTKKKSSSLELTEEEKEETKQKAQELSDEAFQTYIDKEEKITNSFLKREKALEKYVDSERKNYLEAISSQQVPDDSLVNEAVEKYEKKLQELYLKKYDAFSSWIKKEAKLLKENLDNFKQDVTFEKETIKKKKQEVKDIEKHIRDEEKDTKKELKKLEKKVTDADQKLSKKKLEYDELVEKQSEQVDALVKREVEVAAREKEYAKKEKKLEALKEAITKATEDKKSATTKLSTLKKQIKEKESRIKQIDKDLVTREKEINEKTKVLETLKKQEQKFLDEHKKMQDLLDKRQASVLEKINQNEQILRTVELKQKSLQELEDKIEQEGFQSYINAKLDQINPDESTINDDEHIFSNSPELGSKIHHLMIECKQELQLQNFSKAKKLYAQIRQEYVDIDLPREEKSLLYAKIRELYDDINLSMLQARSEVRSVDVS